MQEKSIKHQQPGDPPIIVLQPNEVSEFLCDKGVSFENMSSYLGEVLNEQDIRDLSLCLEKDRQLEILDERNCLEQIRLAKLNRLKSSLNKFTQPKAEVVGSHRSNKAAKGKTVIEEFKQ